MSGRDTVVLVDGQGGVVGAAGKQAAHSAPGQRHLAFSVFLFAPDGRLLVQQRARSKYHFAGIWANSCCSHPAPGEDVRGSARLRVAEELGITLPEGALREAGRFEYRAVDPTSGLVEHELDHVLVATLVDADVPPFDAAEIDAVSWVTVEAVRGAGPARGFAPWFAPALEIALRCPS